MGSINLSREHLLETLTEVVGFKAGIVIDEARLLGIVGTGGPVGGILDPNGVGGGRVRSEDVADAVALLLHAVGNTASPMRTFSIGDMYHRYKRDPAALKLYMDVGELFGTWSRQAALSTPDGTVRDATPFVLAAARAHGQPGMDMAMEMIEGLNRDAHQSPWTDMRMVDRADEVELRNLFDSESLTPSHGTFVDQRFIDYLNRNFDDIDNMPWRKFEGLAGEWFTREGYQVAMGKGRGDGGVDLRVHHPDAAPDAPALILVQCKRTKARVDQGIVKAIYADVLHERAGSGLIVTTSGLQPGAERLRTARGYNVETADRKAIRDWLALMRSGE